MITIPYTYPLSKIWFLAFMVLAWLPQAHGQTTPEAFDGSFRLQTGEVITGGYFVEGGQDSFVYMDTENLRKGGLFERVGGMVFQSNLPPGTVKVEFIPDSDGKINTLVWREPGHVPISGRRIYPHRSQDIRFTSEDGTLLQGRLLLPECAGPHPVIIAIHGSGPVNRYGGPYHTYFLKHGIAVLAYDKRGYTTDKDAWREPNLSSLSADAAAAVRFASTQEELDRDRIGIFGSSQAGWVVPRAAVESPETDFVILRAGAVVSQLETVLHETRQELRGKGLKGLDLDYAMQLRREIYTLAIKGRPISETDALVMPYLDEPWYQTAFGKGPISGRWSAHWWEWAGRNLAIAATPHVEKLDMPVLWFLAGMDENVPLVSTRAALQRAFLASPGDDQAIVVLDEALHSFLIQSSDGPPLFSEGFFGRMGAWIENHGISDTKCWSSVGATSNENPD